MSNIKHPSFLSAAYSKRAQKYRRKQPLSRGTLCGFSIFQKQQGAAHLYGALLPKKQILHERLLQAAWQKDAVRSLRPLCDFKLPPPQSKQSSHILLSLSAYAVDTFIIEQLHALCKSL